MRRVLYCICDEANNDTCPQCAKHKRIKPNYTGHYQNLKRVHDPEKVEDALKEMTE